MTVIPIHVVFDVLAALAAVGMTALIRSWFGDSLAAGWFPSRGYLAALIAGAASGGISLGTINLALSSQPGIGRSVLGALLGAILAVEAYKGAHGIRISTGLIFVPALCVSVIVGRLGCFFSGMKDFTYGTPTHVAWAWDFGDGIPRHPVQLYEALAMLGFLVVALQQLAGGSPFFRRNGFYLFAGWYGVQRFAWEFLKPYTSVVGRLNVFHFGAFALVLYALLMIGRTEHARAQQPA